VEKNNQYATEIGRLRTKAAECRLTVVESQLSLALTLCTLAHAEINYNRRDEALKLVNKLHYHSGIIRVHINEPDHLPRIGISEARKQLATLEQGIEEIESRLRRL